MSINGLCLEFRCAFVSTCGREKNLSSKKNRLRGDSAVYKELVTLSFLYEAEDCSANFVLVGSRRAAQYLNNLHIGYCCQLPKPCGAL